MLHVETWSRFDHNGIVLTMTRRFDKGNVGIDEAGCVEVAIRRFAAAPALFLDRHDEANHGHRDTFERLDLRKLRGRPVLPVRGCVGERHALQRAEGDGVIARGRVAPVFPFIGFEIGTRFAIAGQICPDGPCRTEPTIGGFVHVGSMLVATPVVAGDVGISSCSSTCTSVW